MSTFSKPGPWYNQKPTGAWDRSGTLDSAQFEDMLNDLTHLTGKSLSKVIKSEASNILGKALQKTGVSTAWLVKMKYTYTEHGDNAMTIPFVRLNGRKVRVRSIKKKGMMVQQKKGWVWKADRINPQWKELQKELKRLLKRAQSRKGLSKGTWIRIQETAKLPPLKPKPPAYAMKAARGFTQRLKSSVGGKQVHEKGGVTYYITIKNFSTTAMAKSTGKAKGPGGYGAFKRAMRGRVDHFNYSMAKGTFDQADKMARKYPGIFTTPPKK
jgi:hypothetical protein